jgi:hypothetical protein
VAFLSGVSHYNHGLDQLDFVQNDLTDLRNYLLTEGGFDTVYEVRDANVNRQLIDDFMGKYFSGPGALVSEEDRLLFYYSGHGGAQNEVEPFLLFQNAAPAKNDFTDALPVRDVHRWARTVPAKHFLIILDSCFSGLDLVNKGSDDANVALASALAGERSGQLLTAGTGDEKAYAVQYSKQKKGSIFTHELIDALRTMSSTEGIVTIGEAFERARKRVGVFDAVENKTMHPHRMELGRKEGLGKGDFIFINPSAQNPLLPPGLYGRGSAITKAPEAELDQELMLKEFDVANNSSDLAVLRTFVSSYKGKKYGQTLVASIEASITVLEHLPTTPRSEGSSGPESSSAPVLPISVFTIEVIPTTDASKFKDLDPTKYRIVAAQGAIQAQCLRCGLSSPALIVSGGGLQTLTRPFSGHEPDPWLKVCEILNGEIYNKLTERRAK